MIRILKEGKTPDKAVKFDCYNCGCEFETDEYEITALNRNTWYARCYCPCCDEIVCAEVD